MIAPDQIEVLTPVGGSARLRQLEALAVSYRTAGAPEVAAALAIVIALARDGAAPSTPTPTPKRSRVQRKRGAKSVGWWTLAGELSPAERALIGGVARGRCRGRGARVVRHGATVRVPGSLRLRVRWALLFDLATARPDERPALLEAIRALGLASEVRP